MTEFEITINEARVGLQKTVKKKKASLLRINTSLFSAYSELSPEIINSPTDNPTVDVIGGMTL